MDVHTLDQLKLSAPPGKRLVVLGDPVGHSLSPAMHNAALAEMAIERPELGDWRYEAVHVAADDLPEALPLLHEAGVRGINLTIPHKVRALDLVEAVEESVRPMGAVNTLIRTESGYRATNTDGYGIRKAVEESLGLYLKDRDIWIFGAGGAARGIVVACLLARCRRLTVVNRSEPRLRELEQQVLTGQIADGDRVRFHLSSEAPADQEDGALLINATSLGLKESDPCPIEPACLRAGAHVYDTTYGSPNRLGALCRERGLSYANGLSMLVWQGARSLEIWTGCPVPAAVMRAAAEAQLKERSRHG